MGENLAGRVHVAPVHEFPPEKFRLILAVMLEAPFRLARAALRLIEPAEVAELAAYLCSAPASFANGSSYVLDGGWSAR